MSEDFGDFDIEYASLNAEERFTYFKNHSACQTNWNRWLQMKPSWGTHEAAAIMMEIDPEMITEDLIKACEWELKTGYAGRFREYHDFFRRGVESKALPPCFTPEQAAVFAINHGMAVPARLKEWLSESEERLNSFELLQKEVEKFQAENAKLKEQVENAPKEESVYKRQGRSKTIVGTAMSKYRYDPEGLGGRERLQPL